MRCHDQKRDGRGCICIHQKQAASRGKGGGGVIFLPHQLLILQDDLCSANVKSVPRVLFIDIVSDLRAIVSLQPRRPTRRRCREMACTMHSTAAASDAANNSYPNEQNRRVNVPSAPTMQQNKGTIARILDVCLS